MAPCPVEATDSQVARRPANTVDTSSLQIGMMMAVRASGASVCAVTLRTDNACLSPRTITQKPIKPVRNPVTTQADSKANRAICP
ncbi:hypothetical protein D3C71_1569460 [compost metagenome]